jgi:hypothetical protein
MHEEGTNLGRIPGGIEQRIFAVGTLIAAVERFALAPSAAGYDDRPLLRYLFGYEAGPVCYQLAVDTINRAQRTFDLRWRVVFGLKAADAGFDDFAQSSPIGGSGGANLEWLALAFLSVYACSWRGGQLVRGPRRESRFGGAGAADQGVRRPTRQP